MMVLRKRWVWTWQEGSQHKACLCENNGPEDGVSRLSMLHNDGAQVLVQVQSKVQQTCTEQGAA